MGERASDDEIRRAAVGQKAPDGAPARLPAGAILTTLMCPSCGETLLYRPPAPKRGGGMTNGGKTVWCPRRFRDLNGNRVPCGYRGAAPGYFAAKYDPRQGSLF